MTNKKWWPKPPYYPLSRLCNESPLTVLYTVWSVASTSLIHQPPFNTCTQARTLVHVYFLFWWDGETNEKGVFLYMTILIVVSVFWLAHFTVTWFSTWSCQAVAIHSGNPFSWIAEDGIESSISLVMLSRSRWKIIFNTNFNLSFPTDHHRKF